MKRTIVFILAVVMVLSCFSISAMAVNPYLPNWEHIPDGEPHVFEDRVYVYGSHDSRQDSGYCGPDHVTWSAPIDDLTDWRYEGEVFHVKDLLGVEYGNDKKVITQEDVDRNNLFAPDCVYNPDTGLYYMFLFPNPLNQIFVATSESPTGPFENPKWVTFGFDPTAIVDDDGKMYLYYSTETLRDCYAAEFDPVKMEIVEGTLHYPTYTSEMLDRVLKENEGLFWGQMSAEQVAELQSLKAMLEDEENADKLDSQFTMPHKRDTLPNDQHSYFFEGPSIRKVNDIYILSFQRSVWGIEEWLADETQTSLGFGVNGDLAEIGWLWSRDPFGDPEVDPWHYGGVIVSNRGEQVIDPNGDGTAKTYTFTTGQNIHGGMFEVDGQWYQIYHRNGTTYSIKRQSAVEKFDLSFNEDGEPVIKQAEMTSLGFEDALKVDGTVYNAGITCYMLPQVVGTGESTPLIHANDDKNYDPEAEHAEPYISGLTGKSWIGYKYFDFGTIPAKSELTLTLKTFAEGKINVYASDAKDYYEDPEQPKTLVGSVDLEANEEEHTVTIALDELSGKKGIYLQFENDDIVKKTVSAGWWSSETIEVEVPLDFCEFSALSIKAEKKFVDVKPTDWFADEVQYVANEGLMNGTSADVFTPNGTLTRAQIVTILYRAAGEPAVEEKASFSDVAEGEWYSDAIAWAKDNKVVDGYPEGVFKPLNPVTREQIATILYRYENSPKAEGDLSKYPDADTISIYAEDAMTWAVGEGLINGIASEGKDTILAPRNNATRAQFAAIIMRYLEAE